MPATSFRPLNDTHDVGYTAEGCSYMRSGDACTALAEVHLPSLAVIETFACYAYNDSNSAVWNFTLSKRNDDTVGFSMSIAAVEINSSSASTSVLTGTDTTPSSSVNNDLAQCWVSEAADRLKNGDLDCELPPGSFPPSQPYVPHQAPG